jgi:hypothetical protein
MQVIKRSDYLAGACSYDDYYLQFITPRLVKMVESQLGDDIRKSCDEYFNDIPIKKWDVLHVRPLINLAAFREANGWGEGKPTIWAPCDNVCVAKAAAKLIKNMVDILTNSKDDRVLKLLSEYCY